MVTKLTDNKSLQILASHLQDFLKKQNSQPSSSFFQQFSHDDQSRVVDIISKEVFYKKNLNIFLKSFVKGDIIRLDHPSITMEIPPRVSKQISLKEFESSIKSNQPLDDFIKKYIIPQIYLYGGYVSSLEEWLIYIRYLFFKFGPIAFLLAILLALIYMKRTSLINFLKQIPMLLNYWLKALNQLKIRQRIKNTSKLIDVEKPTVLEKIDGDINGPESLDTDLGDYTNVKDLLDYLRYTPIGDSNNQNLVLIAEELYNLMGRDSTAEEFYDNLNYIMKLLIYKNCYNLAVQNCEMQLISFFNKVINSHCSEIIDLIEKRACRVKWLTKGVNRVFKQCLTKEVTNGCNRKYIKAFQQIINLFNRFKSFKS